MATSPTPAQVRVIITTAMTDEQIDAVISDAALMAEKCLSALSDERQVAVLKYLTAHLIASMTGLAGSGRELASKSIGDASESYVSAPITGEGLKLTSYGRQAIMLDPNGCLEKLGKMKVTMKLL